MRKGYRVSVMNRKAAAPAAEGGSGRKDVPDGPHVTLVVVRLALAQLRAEVVGRAHGALSKVRLTAHHLAEAKVAQLHLQCRTMLTYIRQG